MSAYRGWDTPYFPDGKMNWRRSFVAPIGSARGDGLPQRFAFASRSGGSPVMAWQDHTSGKRLDGISMGELEELRQTRKQQFPPRKRKRNFNGKEYRLVMVTDPMLSDVAYIDRLATGNRIPMPSQLKKQRLAISKEMAQKLRGMGYNARVVNWSTQSGIYIKPRDAPTPRLAIGTEGQVLRIDTSAPMMTDLFPTAMESGKFAWPLKAESTRSKQVSNLVERPIVFNRKIDDEEDEEEMSKRVTNPGQDASADFLPGGRIRFNLEDEETRRQILERAEAAGIELSDDDLQRLVDSLSVTAIDETPTAASVRWVRIPIELGGTRHNVEDVTWHPLGRMWTLEDTNVVAIEVMRMQDAIDAGISPAMLGAANPNEPGFIWTSRGSTITEMGSDDPRKDLRD